MPLLNTYTITPNYLLLGSKRRPGLKLNSVKFIVAHDTGNAGATAAQNVAYYQSTANTTYASAHIFVDDKAIIECIPALTAAPEKAWHVRYDVTTDNSAFGDDANDAAIGVEYCFGPNINATEAYNRYVWLLTKLCVQFNLDPQTKIVGHYLLDPSRRTDPVSGLHASGRTYQQLIADVTKLYKEATQQSPSMKLIKNTTSNKVYAIGADNKKHWIFNEETFNIGHEMGMWGDASSIYIENDDAYALGHAVVLIKQ